MCRRHSLRFCFWHVPAGWILVAWLAHAHCLQSLNYCCCCPRHHWEACGCHTRNVSCPLLQPPHMALIRPFSPRSVSVLYFFFFYCCGWRSAHADRQFPLNFKLSYTINMQIEWVFFLSVYFSLFVGPFNLVCWARCAVEALVSGFTKTPPLTLALGSIVDDMPCARRPPPICWVKGRKQFL